MQSQHFIFKHMMLKPIALKPLALKPIVLALSLMFGALNAQAGDVCDYDAGLGDTLGSSATGTGAFACG